MQMKKAEGTIKNNAALKKGATSVVCEWYATYESEESKYFPVVKAGAEAASLAAVNANEGASLTGASTGKTNGGEKNYPIYKYTTTYTLPEGAVFFSLEASGSSASYVLSWTLK